MSQDSVLKLLKRKNKWMTGKEICKELGLAKSSINNSLNKLYKRREIFKDNRRHDSTFVYMPWWRYKK